MQTFTLQTVRSDSPFARLDFRSKLYMMFILAFIAIVWESAILEGLLALSVVLACLVGGIKLRYISKIIILMIPFYILLIITQGFFAQDLVLTLTRQTNLTPLFAIPENWFLVGGMIMSLEGIEYALSVIFKTLTLTLMIPLGIFTTDVNTMIIGLVKIRIPYKIAFIFSSTLRFFPLLFDEIHNIIEAQKLRGLSIEKLRPIKRIQIYARIAVPLILGVLVKSQMLGVVLQAKGFSGSSERTYLHESKLGIRDYGLIGLFSVFLITAVVTYFIWGLGRFRGPI